LALPTQRPVTIAHYRLLEPIGRDGASEIYRARDLRLGREVAVKLLRPDAMARPEALERFRREAHISSLVSHPHICAVHDSGEEAGRPFLVCELLDGRALDEVIGGIPLPPERLLDIGVQIADALAAAHRRHIIHGNLKPSNVFITSDGHVKLLELGAASAATPPTPSASAADDATRTTSVKLELAPPTRSGELFHAYLAPEQVAGHRTDERADLFALGALLYEMGTGRRAFPGATPAEIAASISAGDPAPPRSLNRDLPPVVEPIITRALARDPEARYQSAVEILNDMRRARRAVENPVTVARGRPFRRLIAASAMGVALILLLGAGVVWGWRILGGSGSEERSTILVSHIANGTADPDFDGTLREAVSVYLGQSPYLELVSDERIRSALQLMGRDPATRMTHDVAAEVCQRLGLQAMLEGSVSAVGRATVVALVATDCVTGETIARQQIEVERKEDVLRAVGPLSAAMRTSLGESRASLARHNVSIEEATTPSLEALKAYTEGTARRAAGEELDAIPFLERAITLDPRFALAHATLSTLYGGLGETGRSEEFARLAYENREHVSERERLFITYQYYDRVTGDQLKARETLAVWEQTYPRDYRPANALAVLLLRFGDYEGAKTEAEEAIRRNPAHAFPYSNLAYAHRGAGRFADARAVAEQTIAKKIETLPLRRLLYQLAEIDRDEKTAQAQLDWAAGSTRRFDMTGARAQVLAYRGQISEARVLYGDTIKSAAAQGFAQVASGYASQAALTEAVYGYRDQAIQRARPITRTATAYEPQLRAATALALAGAPEEADVVIRRLRTVRPEDTLLHSVYLPSAEAALHLSRARTMEAIEQLRPAQQYERGTIAALLPMYLRGEARLRAGAFDDAAREFRTIVDLRGADPFSPLVPISQLGLARALAAGGDVAGSRNIYDALLDFWKSADPGFPALLDARKEREALR
jgi:serine/threonine protein kinase/tetratricopeptide (TPR) repeat protein